MRAELKIFIAGSKALKSQRTLIRDVASNLATDYERKNRKVNLSVYSFENFGLTFDKNGQQSNYDEFIRSHADLVIFVFENKVMQSFFSSLHIPSSFKPFTTLAISNTPKSDA